MKNDHALEISVTQFKATCLGLIDQVQKDKSRITITRHGKPAAEKKIIHWNDTHRILQIISL